jgi:hypothetical protein
MWRRRGDEPALTRNDVQTIMNALFDLRRDVTEILRILSENGGGEEETEEADG